MSASPWKPPGLSALGSLPIGLTVDSGGTLEEAHVRWAPSHHVITSEYAGENLFDRLVGEADLDDYRKELAEYREIADLTNGHVQSEAGLIDLVRPDDRIYGRGAGLIMAAFAFPGPPSRFSDGTAGTYYAAESRETAIAENVHHAERFLEGTDPCVIEKTLVHADLDATLVDVRSGHPAPPGLYHATDYAAGQAFGSVVRHLGGFGIVYDSVRRAGGECAAVFRPPAVENARPVQTILYE